MFLLCGMYFFHFFHSFYAKIFSLQIKLLNSPNGIYASGKGTTKLAYIHLTSRGLFWAMPCGPLPNSEIWAGR